MITYRLKKTLAGNLNTNKRSRKTGDRLSNWVFVVFGRFNESVVNNTIQTF